VLNGPDADALRVIGWVRVIADLTFGQSLAVGALGGVIGAGSSLLAAWMAGRQGREKDQAERTARIEERAEERRIANLEAFQDAVDAWQRAYMDRLASFEGHSPQDPPTNASYIALVDAQSSLRTAAGRVGDADLAAEMGQVSKLTVEASNHPAGVSVGKLGERLVSGTSVMIRDHCTWNQWATRNPV
jgi:hypothetical protein